MKYFHNLLAILAIFFIGVACEQPAERTSIPPTPHDADVFVHLFAWSWPDVARECEEFLGPNGYKAVQISPPHEHAVLSGRPWYEMYQPVSYTIGSRNGNRQEYQDMVERCKEAGVSIYADAVINHMSGMEEGTGSAGTSFTHYEYSGLYSYDDFHHCDTEYGDIHDYQNAWEVQHCELVNLADLRTESDAVRDQIAGYLNDLLSMGTDGFRLDASKHMPPEDIAAITGRLNGEPYIFQEVIDHGTEPITATMYTPNGDVTEFKFSGTLSHHFLQGSISSLNTITQEHLINGDQAVVFVDNHDNQRGHGGNVQIVTHKDSTQYVLANVFMLAWPYGYPKVMSSYAFSEHSQGPPTNPDGTTRSVYQDDGLDCFGNRWQCEHRWPAIANMVTFRKAVEAAPTVDNWWSDGKNQIAFSRGTLGFVAINNSDSSLQERLQTGLKAGRYCNMIQENLPGMPCHGPAVDVSEDGTALIEVPAGSALVISLNSREAAN